MNIANAAFQKKTRRRTRFLVIGLSVWSLGIAARLFQLQVLGHARLSAQVVEQNRRHVPIVPERGTIFDRYGQILAQSIPVQSVNYNPIIGEALDLQMRPVLRLRPILKLSDADIDRITGELRDGAHFVYLKRKADLEMAAKAKVLGIPGIGVEDEKKRFYPQGFLASHILGGVGIEDKGQAGIELKFDDVLKGDSGEQIILVDAKKRTYDMQVLKEPRRGQDIELTIDATIQYLAEAALKRAMAEQQAAWGTVIVAVPDTGEILAMASAPDYDPNEFSRAGAEATINRAIRQPYEPGSTFKIVTASAALENRRVSLSQSFDCSKGAIEAAGGAIRDHETMGILTFPEVVIRSSNVGSVQVGRQVGSSLMFQTVKAFGFGERTRIELPAEAPGIVHPPGEWTRRSLDSISIGYEITATALQVLEAANIIANRGTYVPPRIVKSVAGAPVKRGADQARIISEQAAQSLAAILERVVLEGTGKAAAAAGFSVAGKTGTTQIFDRVLQTYQSSKHIASFVGFVPAEKPKLSIIVVLAEPKKDAYYGGLVAAPVFREIAVRSLRAKGIFPRPDAGRNILAAKAGKGKRP
jgi:cell division protein FtsI/penicillin-binding protein 2